MQNGYSQVGNAMAKKHTKTVPTATPSNPKTFLTGVNNLPLRLDRIALREASYEEMEAQAPPTPISPGQPMSMRVNVQGGVGTRGELLELKLDLTIEPDPAHIPIKVRVVYSAFYNRSPKVSDEDAIGFLHGAGVRILFPYIREAVSSLTSRGIFGPVWLDPMDIQIIQANTGPAD